MQSELQASCLDGRYDLARLVATSAPIYDKGTLAAVKVSEIHKSMVIKKFEKYIVTYVMTGSVMKGLSSEKSDIDVFVVIDDTDVKKMTRAELKDKLRAIIIGMAIEAGDVTGIRNKIHVQVYILTEFWDSIKEANPVIFDLLRDGVPLYDRGMFTPWKQLLMMGKVRPSSEAIQMFLESGDQMSNRVQLKLKEIAMEDVFWATITPTQAALMLFGIAPPSPKETAKLMRDVFVKKEKLLEEKYVAMYEDFYKTRKAIEYGDKKTVSGKELDTLLSNSDKYLKRIKRLFTQIKEQKDKESVLHNYETCITIIRDILRLEGIEKIKDDEEMKLFKSEMVNRGLIPEKYLRILNTIIKAKKDFDSNKLTKADVEKVRKDAGDFVKFMVEYLQRKRGRELEKTRIRVKHGERFGEVLLLGDVAFIVHDLDNEQKEISKAKLTKEGGIGTPEESNLEEMEKHLAQIEIPPKVFIKEKIFEDLKRIFGKDVEVLVTY